MSAVNKIDSNITGLRIAEEASLGVLPAAASQVWYPAEPNSYSDFGSQVTTVARNPINPGRKRKKGVVTDIEASGGFNTDLTQTNLQRPLQGFFFASAREKATTRPLNSAGVALTGVVAADDEYTAASGLAVIKTDDLILASGFAIAANNGLKLVVTGNTATSVEVPDGLVNETPSADAKLTVVGHQYADSDVTLTNSGTSYPTLGCTAGDFTLLGLVPGEWIFIGGDTATLRFATGANNGFARVRSVAAKLITLDKTSSTTVTDNGSGKTIQIFVGRVLKDETGTAVVRRTYQLERDLGYNNDADTTKRQAEYLIGSVANEFTLNVPTAEKVTADLSFVSLRGQTIDENLTGANTLKSKAAVVAGSAANAPAIVEADAFNTSSDISRIKLSTVSTSNANPTALFAFVQELTVSVNNNASGNKALGVIGSFEVTAGTFEVGGSMTAYFADVAAVTAVQNNADITLDGHFVKANAGVSFDMPLLALGDGRPNVEQDQPITLPLENSAADGAKIHPTLNHTLMLVFWDYLPSLADS